jgi:hypothetical protein
MIIAETVFIFYQTQPVGYEKHLVFPATCGQMCAKIKFHGPAGSPACSRIVKFLCGGAEGHDRLRGEGISEPLWEI